MRLLVLAALLFASPASAQILSYPPVDVSTLMPRAEAETTINGFDTRITALEGRSARYLNDVTLAQSALVSIAAGPRQVSVTTNCLPGDRMFMSPSDTIPIPAGYMLGDIRCTTAGAAVATLYAPLLAIGGSYSITVRVTAFR